MIKLWLEVPVISNLLLVHTFLRPLFFMKPVLIGARVFILSRIWVLISVFPDSWDHQKHNLVLSFSLRLGKWPQSKSNFQQIIWIFPNLRLTIHYFISSLILSKRYLLKILTRLFSFSETDWYGSTSFLSLEVKFSKLASCYFGQKDLHSYEYFY